MENLKWIIYKNMYIVQTINIFLHFLSHLLHFQLYTKSPLVNIDVSSPSYPISSCKYPLP
jgi:hypothetical protein